MTMAYTILSDNNTAIMFTKHHDHGDINYISHGINNTTSACEIISPVYSHDRTGST